MKTTSIIAVFFLSSLASLLAQTPTVTASGAPAVQGSTLPVPTAYAIVAKDANSRVWQRTVYEQDSSGNVVPQLHRYTELASGLNHLVNGQWVESSEQIVILPNGTAAATNGQHQAYFPGDIYEGEIELVTPDGKQIYSQPLALTYFDGTNTVAIAGLTNSVGVVVGDNQVIYPNAFTGISADLRYTYTKAGFEQDVILHQQPLTPESYGLNAETARLQLMTEFVSSTQPTAQSSILPPQAGVALTDQSLNFGAMQMASGRAFLLGQNAQNATVLVAKHWVRVQGRQVLIEEVPVEAIVPGLAALPVAMAPVNKPMPVAWEQFQLPQRRMAKHQPNATMLLSKANLPMQGFVLDYQTLINNLTNYTFQGDSTYYISGTVNLYGTNTFEGGTVLKYTNNATIGALSAMVKVNWITEAYRPVIFTAKDDNSVGETIAGSTGNPTGYYANPALTLVAVHPAPALSYFRISYAYQALSLAGGSFFEIENGQIVNCQNGITINSIYQTALENILFANTQTNINSVVDSTLITAENITFNSSLYLATVQDSVAINLTNCILANIYYLTNAGIALDGNDNGFYGSPEFGASCLATVANPFQTVGAGSYYLTNGCVFRNAGSTNIDTLLLAGLKQKTTYPPIVYSNTTIAVNTTLSPQAQRDTESPGPDLGYHYDPIDYAIGGSDLFTNMTVAAGTTIAWFESASGNVSSSGQSYGLSLNNGANLTLQGTVTAPCWMVKYDTVQEGSWGGSSWMGGIMFNGSSSATPPQLSGTFSKWSGLAADGNDFRDNWNYGTASFQNSEFYGNTISAYDQSSLIFTNCLFFRMGTYYYAYGQPIAQNITYLNCSFFNGFISMNRYNGQPTTVWTIKNTAFDGTGFSTTDNLNGNTNYTQFDYNAFNTNNLNGLSYSYPYTPVPTNLLENIGPHDLTISGYNWQSSWFGGFYLPTNSSLVNAGSATANQFGFYYFTTQTNQVPETNSVVDIGYHYVATDSNGNPLATFNDGIPDYLDDTDGNGLPDWWEIANFGLIGVDPNADADGDGLSNLLEYQLGTNPNSPNSAIPLSFTVLKCPQ